CRRAAPANRQGCAPGYCRANRPASRGCIIGWADQRSLCYGRECQSCATKPPVNEADAGQSLWRRRLARLLLVGGIALAATQLLGGIPKEQELVVRLQTPVAVRTLNATWFDTEGQEVGGVTLHFPAGRKRTIRHHVELPDGSYEIHVELELLDAESPDWHPRPKTNL